MRHQGPSAGRMCPKFEEHSRRSSAKLPRVTFPPPHNVRRPVAQQLGRPSQNVRIFHLARGESLHEIPFQPPGICPSFERTILSLNEHEVRRAQIELLRKAR